ncbi:MAG: transposase [Actinomycetota bacterium]|nr:transposase [Actinomycetota bacterium]
MPELTCVRIDATVTDAHSDKEGAEPNFTGFGHHRLQAYCDNTGGEPLAWIRWSMKPRRISRTSGLLSTGMHGLLAYYRCP